jgi:benzoyl-CoA reductase subunit C
VAALLRLEPAREEDPAPPTLELSDDLHELDALRTIEEMTRFAREVVADPSLPTARAWARGGGRAIGCFPVYTPQEIVHALGMLPVSLHGGGENLEISHADAPLGSFVCSISKSTLEMAMTGRLAPLSGLIFPYICDVSRNLEGVAGRILPGVPTHMLHLPQNFGSPAAIPFLVAEFRRLIALLERRAPRPYRPEQLDAAIRLFAEYRTRIEQLAALRREKPWQISLVEQYLLVRLGGVVPRERMLPVLDRALAEARARSGRPRDAVRVLLIGPFCEQPTLDLIALLEEVGCYVVEDELEPLPRWCDPVAGAPDPLEALARGYVTTPVDIGVRRAPTTKAAAIRERVARSGAQGVIFLTAKFCEPALEDVVLYRRGLDGMGVPYLHLEFEEKSTAYEQSRLQLETFVESILFD